MTSEEYRMTYDITNAESLSQQCTSSATLSLGSFHLDPLLFLQSLIGNLELFAFTSPGGDLREGSTKLGYCWFYG